MAGLSGDSSADFKDVDARNERGHEKGRNCEAWRNQAEAGRAGFGRRQGQGNIDCAVPSRLKRR
jgi:hypothetical protein